MASEAPRRATTAPTVRWKTESSLALLRCLRRRSNRTPTRLRLTPLIQAERESAILPGPVDARRPLSQQRAGHVEVPVGLPACARLAAVCGLAHSRQRPLRLLAGAFQRATRTVSVRPEPCTESGYRYRCSRRCGTTCTRSGPRGRRATGQSPTCISGVVFIISRATRRSGNP